MRKPTTERDALAWWRNAIERCKADGGRLRDLGPAFDMNAPQSGYFQTKEVRGGPFLGVRIWLKGETDPDTRELIGDEVITCTVDGADADPFEQWVRVCDRPITLARYNFLIDLSLFTRFGKDADPLEPMATPTKAVDWMTAPPPRIPKQKKGKPANVIGRKPTRNAGR